MLNVAQKAMVSIIYENHIFIQFKNNKFQQARTQKVVFCIQNKDYKILSTKKLFQVTSGFRFFCDKLFLSSTLYGFTESYLLIFSQPANPRRPMSEQQDSQVYAPQLYQSCDEGESCQIYKRRVEKTYEKSIEGKWTEMQNLKYILFMDYHTKIFVSKQKRKSQRIFKSLSDFLATRTPRQCRSHFQKIMNKFKKLKKVKQFYQEQIGIQRYQFELDKLSKQLSVHSPKVEETAENRIITTNNVEVQTDPLKVCLSDLSGTELIKLMGILNQYQKSQVPFWMPQHVDISNTCLKSLMKQ